ncbi:MAG: amylo-alpha-1,6-glucosidase [Actinobacteria bacterium]|nr:amylo-alpha-1,6-glucosidase [Actinomycetota bacterium]
MRDDLMVLDGSAFFISGRSGDIGREFPSGFFAEDVRHLSAWRFLFDGEPAQLLTSRNIDYFSARMVMAPAGRQESTVAIVRDRFVMEGVHEDITVTNHSDEVRRSRVELVFGCDFADVMETQGDPPGDDGEISVELDGQVATLWYERDGFRRGTTLTFGERCTLWNDRAVFELSLGARERWKTCIDIAPIVDGETREPRLRCDSFGAAEPEQTLTIGEWIESAPQIETDSDSLRRIYRRSLADLASLRLRPDRASEAAMPAGGIPWFMAMFGRDSIIAAYQALPFQASLAATTLRALAARQATADDPWRDAEAGKILHELRKGKLASLGEIPHTPYYGAHDATLLFLILLDEYERWTGDSDLVLELEGNARAAVDWIEGPADSHGDGYLEYKTRPSSERALENQCWKDSHNSMLFADGRQAKPPIATCEIQGYAYDARVRVARLARELWGDEPFAERLERDAAKLRERFERDFWIETRGHYALALDAVKHQVDAMTTNVGHLLWSGIVSVERAEMIVRRLLAEDMFSGWGLRTMSTNDAGFNPLAYHNGTVWPHDTAIVAEGMRRYGFRGEAARLVKSLLEAAEAFASQLPEVFAGLARDSTGLPVEYADALKPQAWAAGTPLLGIRTLLGLDVVNGELRGEPHLPEGIAKLGLLGVRVRGRELNVPLGE